MLPDLARPGGEVAGGDDGEPFVEVRRERVQGLAAAEVDRGIGGAGRCRALSNPARMSAASGRLMGETSAGTHPLPTARHSTSGETAATVRRPARAPGRAGAGPGPARGQGGQPLLFGAQQVGGPWRPRHSHREVVAEAPHLIVPAAVYLTEIQPGQVRVLFTQEGPHQRFIDLSVDAVHGPFQFLEFPTGLCHHGRSGCC